MEAQISTFREVLVQQRVGVLVGATLPWALWIAEVDLNTHIDLEPIMLGHLSTLIPSQRTAKFFGQGDDGTRYRVAHRPRAMARKRRPALRARRRALQGGEDAAAS